MQATSIIVTLAGLIAILGSPALAQGVSGAASDPGMILTQRLDLERYKATIKGLTQFGDRRQGTDRNANAVTWIETQLKSYGCANVEDRKSVV